MADQIAEKIIAVALATRRSHPDVPAIDVLDLAMDGHHGNDLDMEADGQPFADWLDPPSEFARILQAAFAPEQPLEAFFSGADVWCDRLPDGQLMADVWHEQVLGRFATRYNLWGQ